MKEYVERSAAIAALEDTDWYTINKNGEVVLGASSGKSALFKANDMFALLRNAPAADVEPVRHGKWTGFPNNNVWSIKCSECHRLLPFGTLPEEMEYCPHCGARMDGGNKNV